MGAFELEGEIDAAAGAVLLALHHHRAVEPALQIGRQAVIGGVQLENSVWPPSDGMSMP